MRFPNLNARLRLALAEDRAEADITSRAIPGFAREAVRTDVLIKKDGVFYGAELASRVFRLVDRRARVSMKKKDGARVRAGEVAGTVRCRLGALLAGERTYLNLACHLSGIATLTARFVEAVKGTGAAILDTRKTTPLWRDLEKDAVRRGGGRNHRLSLADAVLVKDNHSEYLRGAGLDPAQVYRRDRFPRTAFVEMEAKTPSEVWAAIRANADIVLLDNMAREDLQSSILFVKSARVALGRPTPLIEVSGGVTLETVRSYAELGVDRISVGALTHSAPALDISLEVK